MGDVKHDIYPNSRGVAVSPQRDIGWAIKQMWNGQAVTRRGWNGRGQFIKIQIPDAHSANTGPIVWLRTVQGGCVPWSASQMDLLAIDWQFHETP